MRNSICPISTAALKQSSAILNFWANSFACPRQVPGGTPPSQLRRVLKRRFRPAQFPAGAQSALPAVAADILWKGRGNVRKLKRHGLRIAISALLFSSRACCAARDDCFADEGMWTFDNPPLKQLKERYGFTPTRAWLDHVRLSSVRFNDGGSGAFVSPHGLVLTNHHVALLQLQKLSTAGHDYASRRLLRAHRRRRN